MGASIQPNRMLPQPVKRKMLALSFSKSGASEKVYRSRPRNAKTYPQPQEGGS